MAKLHSACQQRWSTEQLPLVPAKQATPMPYDKDIRLIDTYKDLRIKYCIYILYMTRLYHICGSRPMGGSNSLREAYFLERSADAQARRLYEHIAAAAGIMTPSPRGPATGSGGRDPEVAEEQKGPGALGGPL